MESYSTCSLGSSLLHQTTSLWDASPGCLYFDPTIHDADSTCSLDWKPLLAIFVVRSLTLTVPCCPTSTTSLGFLLAPASNSLSTQTFPKLTPKQGLPLLKTLSILRGLKISPHNHFLMTQRTTVTLQGRKPAEAASIKESIRTVSLSSLSGAVPGPLPPTKRIKIRRCSGPFYKKT